MSPKKSTPKRQKAARAGGSSARPRSLRLGSTPSSGISGLTTVTESSPTTRRHIEDRSTVSLFQLSNLPDSPQKRRQDPSEEEDDYDAKCYEENAGAEDSEEEDEVQVNDGKRGFPTDDDHEHEQAAHLNDYTEIKKEPGLNEQFCYGAPIGWKPPTDPPKDWKERKRNAQKGEPEFNKVDNPGNWSSFAFQPRFARANGKHVRHALPAGAEPVPEDDNGVRKVGDWTFHYQGWKNDERARTFRNGATKGNMFPKSRSGSLDQAKLLRAGLTKERMEDPVSRLPDALFFYFLLLPVHLIDSEKGMCPSKVTQELPFTQTSPSTQISMLLANLSSALVTVINSKLQHQQSLYGGMVS